MSEENRKPNRQFVNLVISTIRGSQLVKEKRVCDDYHSLGVCFQEKSTKIKRASYSSGYTVRNTNPVDGRT